MKKRFAVPSWFRVGIGLVACVGASAMTAFSPAPRDWHTFLPLGFSVVVILLALRYGQAVALIGAPVAALMFAYFLFAPVGSFHVENEAARGSLSWMMLGSIVLAFLLRPSPPATRGK